MRAHPYSAMRLDDGRGGLHQIGARSAPPLAKKFGDLEVAAPRALLYRTPSPADVICVDTRMARWRSGDAADCKSVHPGSIPGRASTASRRSIPLIILARVFSRASSADLGDGRGSRKTPTSSRPACDGQLSGFPPYQPPPHKL